MQYGAVQRGPWCALVPPSADGIWRWRWASAQDGHSHLRPTYAQLTPHLRQSDNSCHGLSEPSQGDHKAALGRGKLVVVLMAYATTYAQLTPAYAITSQTKTFATSFRK